MTLCLTLVFSLLLFISIDAESLRLSPYKALIQNTDRKTGKLAFAEYSRSLSPKNSQLRQKVNRDDSLTYRVVTFNVEKMKKGIEVIKTLRDIDADVVVLQEIRAHHLPMLRTLGYQHEALCFGLRANHYVGNMILSNLTMIDKFKKTFTEWPIPFTRCMVGATFVNRRYRDRLITVLGTHLTFGQTRQAFRNRARELRKIANLVERQSEIGDVILAGDMNEDLVMNKKELMGSLLQDAYDASGSKAPEQTQWRGDRIDFIFVSNDVQVERAATWASPASDHWPQLADIYY